MSRTLVTLLALFSLTACKGGGDDETGPVDTGDPNACDVDVDGDGFCPPDDCDDNRKYTYPGATEIPYNGVDEDCDGSDLNDVDGDGFIGEAAGGDDCNDANDTIYPGAPEECYVTLDYNCDDYIPVDDCDQDGFRRSVDCDDENFDVNPDATEVWYDGVDQDCLYDSDFDFDHDSDEVPWDDAWPLDSWPDQIVVWNKDEPTLKFKYIPKADAKDYWVGLDCNDSDETIGGNLPEIWDGVDRNCDDTIDKFHERDAVTSFVSNAGIGDGALGSTVTWMGDLNDDGFPEIAVADLGALEYTGRVYILSTAAATGKAFERAVADINDLDGEGLLTGWTLQNAGDLTGDGVNDMLAGNIFMAGTGTAMLFDGAELGAGGNLGLTNRIATAAPAAVFGGQLITPIGDANGDGVNEVAIGTGYWNGIGDGNDGTFTVGIFDGAGLGAGGDLVGSDAEALISDEIFGTAIAAGLDLDGDGTNELAMTRYGGGVDGSTGAISCAEGGGSTIHLAPTSSIVGGVLVDVDDFDSITGGPCGGFTLGMIDDVDQDGYAELVVGDPGTDGADTIENGGTIYLIDGDDFADGSTVADIASASVQSAVGQRYMRTELRHGDHDGDGVEDLLVAAPGILDTVHAALEDTIPASGTGTVHYFNSTTLAAGGAFTTDDSEAQFLHRVVGTGMGGSYAVGDMNADGLDDVAVTAPRQGTGGVFLYHSALSN